MEYQENKPRILSNNFGAYGGNVKAFSTSGTYMIDLQDLLYWTTFTFICYISRLLPVSSVCFLIQDSSLFVSYFKCTEYITPFYSLSLCLSLFLYLYICLFLFFSSSLSPSLSFSLSLSYLVSLSLFLFYFSFVCPSLSLYFPFFLPLSPFSLPLSLSFLSLSFSLFSLLYLSISVSYFL